MHWLLSAACIHFQPCQLICIIGRIVFLVQMRKLRLKMVKWPQDLILNLLNSKLVFLLGPVGFMYCRVSCFLEEFICRSLIWPESRISEHPGQRHFIPCYRKESWEFKKWGGLSLGAASRNGEPHGFMVESFAWGALKSELCQYKNSRGEQWGQRAVGSGVQFAPDLMPPQQGSCSGLKSAGSKAAHPSPKGPSRENCTLWKGLAASVL